MTQKEALDILKTGRNVFLTGQAGSGKTYVLRQYINHLKELNASFGVTASTGIAATHMEGITIHSWSGMGIRDSLTKSDILEIADKSHVRKKIKDASVLIIDEVSMLHHYRIDIIDAIVREVKSKNEPFGGMQVVFCGDFFQLPPVSRSGERESFFAYHSDSWKNLNPKVCYLSEQHRQNDLEYLEILNSIRGANLSEKTKKSLMDRLGIKSEFSPTRLYTHNIDVDKENNLELGNISGKVFEYEMRSKGNRNLVESLKKGCLAPEILKLKVGAKVMFVKNNFEEGYVNGTVGIVEKCDYEEIQVRTVSGKLIDAKRESWVLEEDGKIKAEIDQFPLRLAWAITIHKSQGMSLDSAEIDLGKAFEKGMGYVALSRIRTLNGLFLKGINDRALEVNDEVLRHDKKFRELSEKNSFHIRTMGKPKIEELHKEFKEKIKNSPKKEKKLDTVSETKALLDQGFGIKEIAKMRSLKAGTILDHIEEIKDEDPRYNIYNLRKEIGATKFKNIYSAFKKVGLSEDGKFRLAPVKDLLGSKYSYDDIRLVRLFL